MTDSAKIEMRQPLFVPGSEMYRVLPTKCVGLEMRIRLHTPLASDSMLNIICPARPNLVGVAPSCMRAKS